jgi:hypothetical protein
MALALETATLKQIFLRPAPSCALGLSRSIRRDTAPAPYDLGQQKWAGVACFCWRKLRSGDLSQQMWAGLPSFAGANFCYGFLAQDSQLRLRSTARSQWA